MLQVQGEMCVELRSQEVHKELLRPVHQRPVWGGGVCWPAPALRLPHQAGGDTGGGGVTGPGGDPPVPEVLPPHLAFIQIQKTDPREV